MKGCKRIGAALLVLAGLAGPAIVHADTAPTRAAVLKDIEASIGNAADVARVYEALKSAVAREDAAAVADLLHFPLRVGVPGYDSPVRNRRTFLRHYRRIMHPGVVQAIADSRLEDVFVNSHGVMLGSGEVWITVWCRDRACDTTSAGVVTLQYEE